MHHLRPHVCHHVICQHRIEVEVWPAAAEVSFRDERFAQPLEAQVQFSAFVYNAPSNRVTWQVLDLHGGPGAGTIDAAGLYTAPAKADLPTGLTAPYSLTDIVVATSVDDHFRKAFAHVEIVGWGPEPPPAPRVEIYPHRVYLYYQDGPYNNYIDPSNTMQLFRAIVHHADPAQVMWSISGVGVADTGPDYGPEHLFTAPATGSAQEVRIDAKIPGTTPIAADSVTVSLSNYFWPGIVTDLPTP
jgi:hypothetical protein